MAAVAVIALFQTGQASGQHSPLEVQAAVKSKIEAYKSRHPTNKLPQNAVNGSFARELEDVVDTVMMMNPFSAEDACLMLTEILKTALSRLDLSFDPKKTIYIPPPELPQEFKRGNNPVIDPNWIKDAATRADYAKRLDEYQAQHDKRSEQARLHYIVRTAVGMIEMMLAKEPVEVRPKIQGKLLKKLQGIKLPAEDQERLNKALKISEESKPPK
jgi:hypothetical protein